MQQLYCCNSFYLMNSFLLEMFFSDCYCLLAKHLPIWISVIMLVFWALVRTRIHSSESCTMSWMCSPTTVELYTHKITIYPAHKEANASGFSYAMQASLAFTHVQSSCQKKKNNQQCRGLLLKATVCQGKWNREVDAVIVKYFLLSVRKAQVFREN